MTSDPIYHGCRKSDGTEEKDLFVRFALLSVCMSALGIIIGILISRSLT